ncbi:MAG: restriction endonuclease [Rhizomicrobium sp.]
MTNLMEEARVVAIKGDPDNPALQFDSLQKGEGRYGWSASDTVDLRNLQRQIEASGWGSLTDEQKESYSYAAFLLQLKENDYVIFVNVPEWGKCTFARVSEPYYFQHEDEDFNHRFGVDTNSIRTFDRNDADVHPFLSARLKLRGAHWEIYAREEFDSLIGVLANRAGNERSRSHIDNLTFLLNEIRPQLKEVTRSIHHTHPNYDLEVFVERIFKLMPGIREVRRQGGAGDHGADILVTYTSGLPIPSLQNEETCVVQIKSFSGEHWDTQAVDDIGRAFERYPDATRGLIISTADDSSPALEVALDRLKQVTGKMVHLLIGADLAVLFLRFYDIRQPGDKF